MPLIKIKSDFHDKQKYPSVGGRSIAGEMRECAGFALEAESYDGELYKYKTKRGKTPYDYWYWAEDWVEPFTLEKIKESFEQGSITSDEYFTIIKELNKDE